MDRVRHGEDRASRVVEQPSFDPLVRHARSFGATLQTNGINGSTKVPSSLYSVKSV